MTGTASMNDPGMNDYEIKIGNYIRKRITTFVIG